MERGCRKHIKSRHGWYYYFDKKPQVECQLANQTLPVPFYKSNRCRTHEIPSLPKDSEFAIGFRNWLTSKTAGSRSETQADQIISRAL